MSRRRVALIVGSVIALTYIFTFIPSSPSPASSTHPSIPNQVDRQNEAVGHANEIIPPKMPAPVPGPAQKAIKKNPIPIVGTPDLNKVIEVGEDEKFLAYLPHSGFHNQRIELENAFLLANYLNRTLLLPPVYLWSLAMPWLRFDKCYERLLLQSKRGLGHCKNIPSSFPSPPECLNYETWTSVPWSFFYTMSGFEQHARFHQRYDLSLEWMYENLHIKSKDIHFEKDITPFDFRVYDDPNSKTPVGRFKSRIDVATLQAIPEKVLHFGSVFGSYRILAQTEEHAELHRSLRNNMIFRNEYLLRATESVVSKIGGVKGFAGLHIRIGDGLFARKKTITIDDMYHELVNQFTDLTKEEVETIDDTHMDDRLEDEEYEVKRYRWQGVKSNTSATQEPVVVQHPADEELQRTLKQINPIKMDCAKHQGKTAGFLTPIFLATDAPKPRQNPLFRKLFDTFPCVFVLDDFKDALDEMMRLEVVEDGVNLASYLVPMVDAMIAAHGHTFLGTKDSTFSSYIERYLHPVYIGEEVKLMGVGRKGAQT
jgi:GDP-fucose protein O-fucosyltransferase